MAWTEKYANGRRGRYRSVDGRTVTAGAAPTHREALQLAQREEHKIAAGTWIDPKKGKVTFADYFEQLWFPNLTLELHTRRSYWSTYTKHLKPFFGEKELKAITSTLVQNWVTNLVQAGYQPATIDKLHIHLQTIHDAPGASIEVKINGTSIGSQNLTGVDPDQVVQFTAPVPAAPTMEVTVYNNGTADTGNDFAIDDISLTSRAPASRPASTS